ncbi:PepSY-like domain-containing protein [Spirosoma foliorum]|uniref:PepSY-like domain-containing protein n=1 Tax=Spirosoma foliorum TaxID=2710596 RepID=A0A7G5H0U0_9BACT|nr:PepSY-like domain-containing protein [Spirosoma foliorum]QMW04732.1 PepSY-like domain-containing protein [Spirosoma foliorum]
MYTLLISGLVIFTSAHVASVALTNYIVKATPAITIFTIDVPAAARATVARLYPGVKSVKWEKEDGNYEAGLTHNGKELSLVIDAKGNLLETETTITESALPASVRAYVAKHHAGKKIKEAAEIVDAKGKKTYEAEVGGKDLIFDEKGQFIK